MKKAYSINPPPRLTRAMRWLHGVEVREFPAAWLSRPARKEFDGIRRARNLRTKNVLAGALLAPVGPAVALANPKMLMVLSSMWMGPAWAAIAEGTARENIARRLERMAQMRHYEGKGERLVETRHQNDFRARMEGFDPRTSQQETIAYS